MTIGTGLFDQIPAFEAYGDVIVKLFEDVENAKGIIDFISLMANFWKNVPYNMEDDWKDFVTDVQKQFEKGNRWSTMLHSLGNLKLLGQDFTDGKTLFSEEKYKESGMKFGDIFK